MKARRMAVVWYFHLDLCGHNFRGLVITAPEETYALGLLPMENRKVATTIAPIMNWE